MASGYDTASLKTYANSQADLYGIPRDFFANLISAESAWNPNAVSPKGAQGIAQLMPDTASTINRFDPLASLSFAAKLLREYHDRFGSWDMAAAAYNAGPGAVTKYGGVPPYPETQSYVSKIMSGLGNASNTLPVSSITGSSAPKKKAVTMDSLKILFWAAAVIVGVIVFRGVLK